MMSGSKISNIAVFIDFENFGTQEDFNAGLLMDKLKERGRIIVKKAYADWGRFAKFKYQMLENSVELIELPSYSKRGKNSADIKLVVDAIETAITKNYIDTLVVVSGDSDYTPLISKVREYDKYVIVVGNRGNTSSLLAGYCDELIYYSSLLGTETVTEADIQTAYNLLVRTLSYLEGEGIATRGSQIKSQMRQFNASFNESNLGFSQFHHFLKKAAQDGVISLQKLSHGDYEATLRSSKVGSNKKAQQADEANSKVTDLVLMAIKANDFNSKNGISLSNIAVAVRSFDPDFSLKKYGYSKAQGFKGIVEDIEARGLLKVDFDAATGTHNVQLTPQFKPHFKNLTLPDNFTNIRITRLLASIKRLTDLQKLNLFTIEAAVVLQAAKLANQNITIHKLFETCYHNLGDYEQTRKAYGQVAQIMLMCHAVKSADKTAITDLADTVAVYYLDNCQVVLNNYIAVVRAESRSEFEEELDEEIIKKTLVERIATTYGTDLEPSSPPEKLSDPFQQLLATIRKAKMQFLGAPLQTLVLKALYLVLTTTPKPLSRQDILAHLVENQLPVMVDTAILSRTKLNGIMQILANAKCFQLSKPDNHSPICLNLAPDIVEFSHLERVHHIYLISIALRNNLYISVAEWTQNLFQDSAQVKCVNDLLDKARAQLQQPSVQSTVNNLPDEDQTPIQEDSKQVEEENSNNKA